MEDDKQARSAPSADMKRQIKDMEDKVRAENIAARVVAVEESVEKISFELWWMMTNSRLKLRSHIKEIMLADFGARGLSKNELKSKFDEALKAFGY